MYQVLIAFSDPVDGGVYQVYDAYPRDGVTPTDERIAYLCGDGNNFGKPVIRWFGPGPDPAEATVPPMTTISEALSETSTASIPGTPAVQPNDENEDGDEDAQSDDEPKNTRKSKE